MRLEGELVVHLAWDGHRVQDARVTSTRTFAASRVLAGKTPADAAAIVPHLFSICSCAQGAAAVNALAGAGARIAELLRPHDDDFFVIKPKHSAFHATPLALLLHHLKVRRIALAGVTSDQCILASANDARMQELDSVIVRDAVETPTAARTRASIRHFEDVLELRTSKADDLPAALLDGR